MDGCGEQRSVRVLAIEPYYGGSHRAFLDALVGRSRHRFEVLTLPARKWKWRMRGSAIWFAEHIRARRLAPADVVLANDMTSVADLRALGPGWLGRCPVVCYFHENQLTYPLSEHDRRDYQYGFTNITSCLASDEVWFNSEYHRRAFLPAVAALLRKMPDHVPGGIAETIEARSRVCRPMVAEPESEDGNAVRRSPRTDGPRILWCHRWEYDKNPQVFFEALMRLEREGVPFRIVLLGESFREAPAVFGEAWSRLANRIEHCAYAADRDAYWRLLHGCDVVVSTAIQENFGIAVVEAMLAGCRPLLPQRLSYPELLPRSLHEACLYKPDETLCDRLRAVAVGSARVVDMGLLKGHLRRLCGLDDRIYLFDNELERVSALAGGSETD